MLNALFFDIWLIIGFVENAMTRPLVLHEDKAVLEEIRDVICRKFKKTLYDHVSTEVFISKSFFQWITA